MPESTRMSLMMVVARAVRQYHSLDAMWLLDVPVCPFGSGLPSNQHTLQRHSIEIFDIDSSSCSSASLHGNLAFSCIFCSILFNVFRSSGNRSNAKEI